MRKNYKKLTAVALTAVMTLGCTMTAFAANATSGDVSGDITGEGSYEGSKIEYPEVKVTLPTSSASNYIDYIVDPYDLITSTLNASGDAINSAYANSEFSGTTGVYFKTSDASGSAVKAKYTETSRPITVTNESAQDIKLTVKVEEFKAASGDAVEYSSSKTFADTDKAKKLYLAVINGEKEQALNASGDATFTINVSGKPDNYVADHDGSKYSYGLKSGATGWSTADYKLTGAVNKNADWAEKIDFPTVQMTWSWEDLGVQKDKAPSITPSPYTLVQGEDAVLSVDLGSGSKAATGVTSAKWNGTEYLGSTVIYNASAKTITIDKAVVNAWRGMADAQQQVVFTLTGSATPITVTFAK